ncbi:MAG: tyrosine-type recombinase/integrase [Gemmatimonadetes bacterium]|nr:tyrosine-type recombinase/integrase [Gemmatimonadota bacterium]
MISVVAPQGLRAVLVEYEAWLRLSGHAASTILTRLIHLRRFVAWSMREGWLALETISLEVLERYQSEVVASRDRRGRPHAWSTRLGRLTSVRLLFRWAVRTRRLLVDPSAELVLPRLPRRLPRAVLSATEVEAVLSAPDVETILGLRDRALLEVLYSTGLRRGEVIRLQVADLDETRALAFVREGKGGKDRVVPVGRRALDWVDRYLATARPRLVARRCDGADPGVLFLGARGDAIRPSRLTERLHGYVRRASGKAGSCHVFRHSMATLMHDGGADIRDLQELLGHAQLSTTEIYTHVSVERLRSVHALTHPAEAGRAWLGHRLGGGIAPLLALPPRGGRFEGPRGSRSGRSIPR